MADYITPKTLAAVACPALDANAPSSIARRLDEFTPLTLGLLTLSAREAHDGALARVVRRDREDPAQCAATGVVVDRLLEHALKCPLRRVLSVARVREAPRAPRARSGPRGLENRVKGPSVSLRDARQGLVERRHFG
jgi:hypothetical protein